MHWVIYRWLFKFLFSKEWVKRTRWILVANFCVLLLYFLGRYQELVPYRIHAWLSVSVGFCFVLFVSAIVYRVLLMACLLLDSKRRDSLKRGLDLSVGALALGYGGWGLYEGMMRPEVRKVKLSLEGLKSPFSMVQISDLHIGGLIDAERVKVIVQEILALHPDVIVLTGDIVDARIDKIQEALDELKHLSAPLGVYYVLGNHEYFHHVYEVLEEIRRCGFCVLDNKGVVLKQGQKELINLVGVNDLFGKRFGDLEPDLELALKNQREDLPTILLAHQPKFAFTIKPDQKIDLILSGHTHGGQIFPFNLLVRLDQPYLAGLYWHSNNTQIYVNRGSGFWGPPMRVGVRAEVTYFEFSS